MTPTLSLTLDSQHLRIDGHRLTPAALAGATITYTSYDGTRKVHALAGVLAGKIIDTYDVDDAGNVRIAMSRHLIVGNAVPGRIVVTLGTTAGELVDGTAEAF